MEAKLPAPDIKATEVSPEHVARSDEFEITQETVPTGLAIIPERFLKFVGLIKQPRADRARRAARPDAPQDTPRASPLG